VSESSTEALEVLTRSLRARNLVENAIGSCLLIPDLSRENAVRARMLRAKSALAAGLHDKADAGKFGSLTTSGHLLMLCQTFVRSLQSIPNSPRPGI
jgi:hypothetical protein